ncbi:MAG TPA: squalene--hopene cyclase, partial [Polyangiaceae bacterium]|nr:squalene--hopene cyclase [Polyangiaceae bacterium]
AVSWAHAQQKPDGHWCAELESNCSITAEYVLMRQALGLDLTGKQAGLVQYLSQHQHQDGSWSIAYDVPGDVSTSAECYLALRILGLPVDDPRLRRAQGFILAQGGLEKMRVFTRIHLALFGLVPWHTVPSLPPELVLLPATSPINIYSFASWARGTIVPLLVLFYHRPVFPLPNGRSANNGWLDHLWHDPHHKQLSGSQALSKILRRHGLGWRAAFTSADLALRQYDKLRLWPFQQIRRQAVDSCVDWILKHQEADGDWAGIFPPMVNGVLALYAHGYRTDSEPLRLGLEAIERFILQDSSGIRVEACQSPVWETTLMMIGLLDCGAVSERLNAPRQWLSRLQILEDHGDWKIYNPRGRPGGWSFEYANTWYPDVDDTAAVVIALVKHDPDSARSNSVRRALDWVISMQNEDGGWAAFDKANDKLFLNEIPFSDMGSLCDPSTPDIVGRVLEALGLVSDRRYEHACARGIAYLRQAQEPEGSWFGRWGVNYIYGTSNVLCALCHHGLGPADPMIARALTWLQSVQNADGGWGESVASYDDRRFMGRGHSTASQTAWALLGLLAFLPVEHRAVQQGVEWLLARQTDEGSWTEKQFTGTGFPRHFYLRYHMYRHYFPLMALGRYLRAAQAS